MPFMRWIKTPALLVIMAVLLVVSPFSALAEEASSDATQAESTSHLHCLEINSLGTFDTTFSEEAESASRHGLKRAIFVRWLLAVRPALVFAPSPHGPTIARGILHPALAGG